MLLIKNANLFNNKVDVLCCNDKIVDIGNINLKMLKESLGNTAIIELIDAKGKVLIPSYIDSHVHIVGGGGENGFSSRIPEINVSDIIRHGVTTVVGVLGTDTTTKSVENLVAKTKGLNEEGITAFCLTGGYEYPSPTLIGSIQKDIAFVNEIIGVKMAISDHRCYNPTKNDLIKLISETRVASLLSGKPGLVNFHVGYGKGNMDVLLDIINETNIPIKHIYPTHVTKNDDILLQAIEMTNLGGYVDVTAGNNIDMIAEQLNYMVLLGNSSNITVSSDSNGSCPIWVDGSFEGMSVSDMSGLHKLVKILILKYNYSLEDAISFITENPARLLGLKAKGKIKPNNDSDLLLLDEDLEIDTVISKGKVLMKNKEILRK